MKKKHVYRVGDIVEVTNDVFPIDYIGYPLHYRKVDIYKDIELFEWCSKVPGGMDYMRLYLMDAVCKTYVARANFGGSKKEIHRHSDPSYLIRSGTKALVIGKCVRMTGTYNSPHLSNAKANIVLTLQIIDDLCTTKEYTAFSRVGEVQQLTSEDVRPVK